MFLNPLTKFSGKITYLSLLWLIFLLSIFFTSSGYGIIYISSIEELQKIGSVYPLDGEYELTQDIDANDTRYWNNGKGFEPIGERLNPFNGKLEGKGHRIIGLYINRISFSEPYGLFGAIGSEGEVKNVRMEDFLITGYRDMGSFAGFNTGKITNCSCRGRIYGHSTIGGLIGENMGTVDGCFSMGSVVGEIFIGGLIGSNTGGVLSNSYNMCRVDGYGRVGGLTGDNYGTIKNCYNIGFVKGMESAGSLIGFLVADEENVINSYWNIEISGLKESDGGIGKTTTEMKRKGTFINWDFEKIWAIEENVTYPYLRWQGKYEQTEGEWGTDEIQKNDKEGKVEQKREGMRNSNDVKEITENIEEVINNVTHGSKEIKEEVTRSIEIQKTENTKGIIEKTGGNPNTITWGCAKNELLNQTNLIKLLVDFLVFGLILLVMVNMHRSRHIK